MHLKELDGMQIGVKERDEMKGLKSLRAKIIPFICKLDSIERLGLSPTIPKTKFPSTIVGLNQAIDKASQYLFDDVPLAQLMPDSEADVKLAYQWLFQEILIKLAEGGSNTLHNYLSQEV